ncbi:Uncharacterised protein [Vibrio cholerae]|nr:Uncharacterised protein [Vibrio cholerae]
MAVKKEPITADLETFSISLSRRSPNVVAN